MKRRSLLALLIALVAPSATFAQAEIDQPAPPLKGHLLGGAPFDLAQMRGKVVLVNFYSSYCKFCAYEIGNLETFYEAHRSEGFEVIAIAVDAPADRERVARTLALYGIPGAMADELDANGFARRYPTPTAFVVDRNGILRHKLTGAKAPRHYQELIAPLLADTGKQ
jgi:cytochrome c biogenesis protein CcmG/thiol:disulfide interchange protein DsbE